MGLVLGMLCCACALAAPGDPVAGKRNTAGCNGCHAQAGMKNVPSIGGQSPAYFIAAMGAYKDGERSHATMRDVAHSLSQRDFANLAAYYSEGDRPAPTATEDVAAPAVSVRCAVCHGADGWSVATPDAPRLAGQKPAYLEQALKGYRSGARRHAVMQEQASLLTDQDIAEITAYYASRAGLFVK